MPDATSANAPTRRRYRFREYHVTAVVDPMTLPTFEAVCVTGEDRDCGATSGELHAEEELTRWIADHCAATGHAFYHRTARAILRAEPGAWQ